MFDFIFNKNIISLLINFNNNNWHNCKLYNFPEKNSTWKITVKCIIIVPGLTVTAIIANIYFYYKNNINLYMFDCELFVSLVSMNMISNGVDQMF